MSKLSISPEGLALIKHFEGYHKEQADGSVVAYLDVGGVPTIGYGSVHGVELGMRWTRKQAEEALLAEIEAAAVTVNQLVTVPIDQHQSDALVSFVYNLGAGAFAKSTLLRKLNAGDYDGAEKEFERWVYATDARTGNKVKWAGLVRRRKAEAAMFGDNDIIPQPVDEPATAANPQKPTTKPVKVPWYSGVFGAVSAAGAWFADKLEGMGELLKNAGGEFMSFLPVQSLFQAAGLTMMPFMAGLAALSLFIAAKTMMSEPETKE